jgi:hypothetical protein
MQLQHDPRSAGSDRRLFFNVALVSSGAHLSLRGQIRVFDRRGLLNIPTMNTLMLPISYLVQLTELTAPNRVRLTGKHGST